MENKGCGIATSTLIFLTCRERNDTCTVWLSFIFIPQGNGSGLGTSVLNLLAEEYPDVYRFTTAVYPSADDDVITSPYNRYTWIVFIGSD